MSPENSVLLIPVEVMYHPGLPVLLQLVLVMHAVHVKASAGSDGRFASPAGVQDRYYSQKTHKASSQAYVHVLTKLKLIRGNL